MKRTSKTLKIAGYVFLGFAFIILFYGIIVTWNNNDRIKIYAAVTVILTAIALFCISLAQKKE